VSCFYFFHPELNRIYSFQWTNDSFHVSLFNGRPHCQIFATLLFSNKYGPFIYVKYIDIRVNFSNGGTHNMVTLLLMFQWSHLNQLHLNPNLVFLSYMNPSIFKTKFTLTRVFGCTTSLKSSIQALSQIYPHNRGYKIETYTLIHDKLQVVKKNIQQVTEIKNHWMGRLDSDLGNTHLLNKYGVELDPMFISLPSTKC